MSSYNFCGKNIFNFIGFCFWCMPPQRDEFVRKVHYPKQYNVGYSKNSDFIYSIDSVINFHLKLWPSRGECRPGPTPQP